MLVLSRKSDESILIGDTIKVVVLEVRGGIVRLGITAPRELPVLRSEVAGRQPVADVQQRSVQRGATIEGRISIMLSDENSEDVLQKFCGQRKACRIPNTEAGMPMTGTSTTATAATTTT